VSAGSDGERGVVREVIATIDAPELERRKAWVDLGDLDLEQLRALGPALATDRVNFIDKDNTRAIAFGLVKKVTDATGTHSNKHLHKLRAADTEKRHSCFTRYSA